MVWPVKTHPAHSDRGSKASEFLPIGGKSDRKLLSIRKIRDLRAARHLAVNAEEEPM